MPRRRTVMMTRATAQPTAIPTAIRPPAVRPAATTGSRHVADTTDEVAFLVEHNFVPIGAAGIHFRDGHFAEIGYWFGFEHWGQGFGTEAARALIDHFFEAFDHELLHGRARVANPMSRNILEKCGFQWSGVELHRFEALGSSSPVDAFRLSRSVWSSLKNWASAAKKVR